MDRGYCTKRPTDPRQKANIFSLVTFLYTIKLYIKGYTKGLELDDIYKIAPDCDVKILAKKLQVHWEKEKTSRKSPSICRALWFSHGKHFLLIGMLVAIMTMITTTLSPKALSKLIAFFSPGQTDLTKQDAIFYGCLVIGISLIDTLVKRNLGLLLVVIGVKAKSAVSALLYRKTLKLSSESLSEVTAGKIVTIITKDVDLFEHFFRFANYVWISAIQTVVICFLIYNKIGVASFPGIVFFLLVLPVQAFIGVLTYKYKLQCSKKSDERLDLIREIVVASKIIKMYTWEAFFERKIHEARKKEMKELHKIFYSSVWITVIGSICSTTAFFIFMLTFVWSNNNISAETVYYVLSCFNDLQYTLSSDVPWGFALCAQLLAAAERIHSVLEAEELPLKPDLMTSKQAGIFLKEVDVKINQSIILKNISISLGKGLNVVIGHTGSGKTSFLKAIMQEKQIRGDVKINGRISYASQEPWLFPSTIKNNILFGEDYDEDRYCKILKICSLGYDLDLLTEGDNTVIGESGINLSKGQQARISLARAVYRNSDIYLLDDCLASLDANVSDAIFEECICKFLNDKMRIIVTNNPEHIQKADEVIVVDSGFVKISNSLKQEKLQPYHINNITEEILEKQEDKSGIKQIYNEVKNSGVVPLKDYFRYIKHGGGYLIFGLLVGVFVVTQSTSSYSDKLLSKWVTLEENLTLYKESNETDEPEYDNIYKERNEKLNLYTAMVVVSILLSLMKSFSFFHFARKASVSIHKILIRKIINSTMKFFESHYVGNILNRCSKDMESIDIVIPFVAMECFTALFAASGGVVLLYSVNHIFLLESILLLLIALAIKQFCQPTGRNLERIHIIARSPLTGHVNSTLEGLTTIRASDAEDLVTNEFDRRQNLYTSGFLMVVTNYITLSVFMKYVCTVFTTVIVFQFLLTEIGGSVGDVGLAITQSFSITSIITSAIMNVADFENVMISLERVLEYTEVEEERRNGKITLGWPELGSISYNNISLSYNNNEMLSNINFVISPKEKIGIVGRTGAGKSSIISSLFRLYPTKGTITIDGIDIKNMSLTWLRSNISIIPQDPYLFPGTIRENLDPLKQHNDERLWNVLKSLQLDVVVRNLDVKIDKGSSFSAGQKQLLCLARAILRKNKIIVLDEATANVDAATEDLIQATVQNHFSQSTMIIIAHKLRSILECDKVLVLNKGRICECGEPAELLKSKTSYLSSVLKAKQ